MVVMSGGMVAKMCGKVACNGGTTLIGSGFKTGVECKGSELTRFKIT